MEQRESALIEALQNNADETARWQQYQKDNETAIENMDSFSKKLQVDVMVPLGSKAYMPGQLIHTNEVLVSHYQGYFSKCSVHKAMQICDWRLQQASEHLSKLDAEEQLWRNKLEKPYAEGIVPQADEREIIEDYDEQKELLWKEQHRINLKKAKLNEKQQRAEQLLDVDSKKAQTDEDTLSKLEEAELMEELEAELEKLEGDAISNETIRQLMSGEMSLAPAKTRTAHCEAQLPETSQESLNGVIKKKYLRSGNNAINCTNNNVQPNPDLIDALDNEAADNEPDVELPEEVKIIRQQAQFLNAEDQIGFYEYQLEIMRQKLRTISLNTQQGIDEKIQCHAVLDHLEELLEIAEDELGAKELAAEEAQQTQADNSLIESQNEANSPAETASSKTQKRKISFALENQTLEFRKEEIVADMLPKTEHTKRDIITLDDDFKSIQKVHKAAVLHSSSAKTKQQSILEKVEQNLSYVAENQSVQDFDLVNKILDAAESNARTLHIKFKHSTQLPKAFNSGNEADQVVGTPAEIYEQHERALKAHEQAPSTLFINSYEGEDQVKTPVLREELRNAAYVDPRMQFSMPGAFLAHASTESGMENIAKSILRNKNAVNQEMHIVNGSSSQSSKKKKKKNKAQPINEQDYMSAYNKVMNEVVEKPLTEPEPLPQGKFIDANAPKKRVSRFKQMRSN